MSISQLDNDMCHSKSAGYCHKQIVIDSDTCSLVMLESDSDNDMCLSTVISRQLQQHLPTSDRINWLRKKPISFLVSFSGTFSNLIVLISSMNENVPNIFLFRIVRNYPVHTTNNINYISRIPKYKNITNVTDLKTSCYLQSSTYLTISCQERSIVKCRDINLQK